MTRAEIQSSFFVISLLIGVLSSLLGAVVLVGWYAHEPLLVQVHASFVPMQANAALGFLACGISLVSFLLGARRLTLLLAFLAALIGGLTIAQYTAAVDFRIDELLIEHYVTVKTSHPGRMAPNTALCFLLTGSALLFFGWESLGHHYQVGELVGGAVFVLGAAALGGYLAHVETAYGWGQLTRMAVHSAVGFVFLGTGIFFTAAYRRGGEGRRRLRLATPAGIVLGLSAVLLWQALAARERSLLRMTVKHQAVGFSQRIHDHLADRILALRRMARRWEDRGGTPAEEWRADAARYVLDQPGWQAIEWIDPSYVVRQIVPLSGNEVALNVDLSLEKQRLAALRSAQIGRQVRVTRTIELAQGGKGFLVIIPVFVGAELDGFVLGVFRVANLLEPLFAEDASKGWSLSVLEDGTTIFGLARPETAGPIYRQAPLSLHGLEWEVAVWPEPSLEDSLGSALPAWVLASGLVIALLFSLTLRFGYRARRHAAKLVELNQTLEDRVRSRTEDLASKAQALTHSNEELQRFAYVASHDLQEPLRCVAGYTQLLSQRYSGKLDSQADEFMAHTLDAVGRMQRLIEDLLVYSRVETHRAPLQLIDAGAALDTAVENLKTAISESATRLTYDEMPRVSADASQLSRLFQNLVANSIKFRGSESPRIHVGATKHNGEWQFSVRDNGIGFEPEMSDRVFDMFQRLNPRDKYPGTGIGLAICKRVVERHGGRIWVESQVQHGSTFFFTLPGEDSVVARGPT